MEARGHNEACTPPGWPQRPQQAAAWRAPLSFPPPPPPTLTYHQAPVLGSKHMAAHSAEAAARGVRPGGDLCRTSYRGGLWLVAWPSMHACTSRPWAGGAAAPAPVGIVQEASSTGRSRSWRVSCARLPPMGWAIRLAGTLRQQAQLTITKEDSGGGGCRPSTCREQGQPAVAALISRWPAGSSLVPCSERPDQHGSGRPAATGPLCQLTHTLIGSLW